MITLIKFDVYLGKFWLGEIYTVANMNANWGINVGCLSSENRSLVYPEPTYPNRLAAENYFRLALPEEARHLVKFIPNGKIFELKKRLATAITSPASSSKTNNRNK